MKFHVKIGDSYDFLVDGETYSDAVAQALRDIPYDSLFHEIQVYHLTNISTTEGSV